MLKSPGEIAFTIGSLDIYYYGIIIACSIFLGLFVILELRKKFFSGIEENRIYDIAFIVIIAGIIGARLYYILLDWDYFSKYPFEIPMLRNGGISIHGAYAGGILSALIYCWKKGLNFLKYADLFVFGLLAGQITGRLGNFFNSEAFGAPVSSDFPLKLFIPYNYRPIEYREYDFFHPAFLYESLLNICIFTVLYLILSKYTRRKNGLIFFLCLILYSLARIAVETVRIDSVLDIAGIHIAHIAAAVFIAAGLTGLALIYRRRNEK